MHLVGSYYTDVSRYTVNRTLNLKLCYTKIFLAGEWDGGELILSDDTTNHAFHESYIFLKSNY